MDRLRAVAATRRLAAIMFTDLVGFTKLGQEDEALALRLRREHQSILRPIFTAHGGREVKSMGDGFLVEFPSAVESVQCAVEVQLALARRNSSLDARDRILLRIGIHVGDVVLEGEDLVGDAVNVASRIEPLADPGGICVSGPVFDQVRNKLPDPMVKLATRELKNVHSPLDVYKVILPWEEHGASAPAASGGNRLRLAVLPLANMSPDPQDVFFSDGLTEEMIAELSRVPGLRVIARTSVMRFRGTSKGISEIAKELNVGTVLEGSARRIGSRVRVTAQLIDARTEEHIWSERYDRELDDIFAIQSEIAAKVAAALHVALPSAPETAREPTSNIEAYQSYLMGRFLWSRRDPDSVRAALRRFEEALRLDPGYAKAYCGVADCFAILMDRGQIRWTEGDSRSRSAARRALELDPSLPEAHASTGLILQHNYDWANAEKELVTAIRLNPMYSWAHHWNYMGYLMTGRGEEAHQELLRALDADPLSPTILIHVGNWAWVHGDDEGALAMWNRAVDLAGPIDTVVVSKAEVLTRKSRTEEAQRLLGEAESVTSPFLGKAFPVILNSLLGREQEARKSLDELLTAETRSYVPAAYLAWAFGALGETDKFFEWAFRSVDERGPGPYVTVVFPIFREMRKDPRYQDYLRIMNLG